MEIVPHWSTGEKTSSIIEQDLAKFSILQWIFLKHSEACLRKANGNECTFIKCRGTKEVLNHMKTCRGVESCKDPICRVSADIFSLVSRHDSSDCTFPDCLFCKGLLPYEVQDIYLYKPKTKIFQRRHQLVCLLHAHKCLVLGNHNCCCLLCRFMKLILEHVVICGKRKTCGVALCESSFELITHWNNCTTKRCYLCSVIEFEESLETNIAPFNSFFMTREDDPEEVNRLPNRLNVIHRRVVSLCHAFKCEQLKDFACDHFDCRLTKNLLNHMRTCDKGKLCTVINCGSSFELIFHLGKCSELDCLTCKQIRFTIKNDFLTLTLNLLGMELDSFRAGHLVTTNGLEKLANSLNMDQNDATVPASCPQRWPTLYQ